ncbi:MAG TPA: alkaline phosphatase family protein, partial [Opitutales bacterium]|nr:alkaline phosphatase family protein [Opitutales bacterium]
LSYAQTGDITATYCAVTFDGSLTDQERLEQTAEIFETNQSLRLLLSYTTSPDREGHHHGPDTPEVLDAVEKLDTLIKTSFERTIDIWEKRKRSPDDRFFLVLTSDHGMSAVQTLVHPEKLAGLENDESAQVITTGNIAQIYLSRSENAESQKDVKNRIVNRLASYDFVSVWRRDEIPKKWHFRHPTRTGDLLLVLEEGYTFNRLATDVLLPLDGTGRSLGTHGYDAATTPDMRTFLMIHSYPDSSPETYLGRVDSLQLHATVARLLDIDPAPKAQPNAIEWNGKEKQELGKQPTH